LGNPGREHAGSRHNLGFLVGEELAARWGLTWRRDRFRGRIADGRAGDPGPGSQRPARVTLLLPQTYMNDAGRSVGPARGALKLPLERVLVVHDEIDLPFGDVRTRIGGGLAGHNGLKSLVRELGSGDFVRVRGGVGRPDSTDPDVVSAWVLGRFREPPEQVQDLVRRSADAAAEIVAGAAPGERRNRSAAAGGGG
jgi:PTH1 family peptidyl-tRNA hydrolase